MIKFVSAASFSSSTVSWICSLVLLHHLARVWVLAMTLSPFEFVLVLLSVGVQHIDRTVRNALSHPTPQGRWAQRLGTIPESSRFSTFRWLTLSKKPGPYRGHRKQGTYFDMPGPKLYIAEIGSYGKNGRPILGLYAGEGIESGRCNVKSFNIS